MHLMTREQSISTYYGELAKIIERPMTPTLPEYPADATEYWGYDKDKALECFKDNPHIHIIIAHTIAENTEIQITDDQFSA